MIQMIHIIYQTSDMYLHTFPPPMDLASFKPHVQTSRHYFISSYTPLHITLAVRFLYAQLPTVSSPLCHAGYIALDHATLAESPIWFS